MTYLVLAKVCCRVARLRGFEPWQRVEFAHEVSTNNLRGLSTLALEFAFSNMLDEVWSDEIGSCGALCI